MPEEGGPAVKQGAEGKRLTWPWVAMYVGILIFLGAGIVHVLVGASQYGLDWSDPWTLGGRGNEKLGWFVFFTYLGVFSTFGLFIVGQLCQWGTAKLWSSASVLIWSAFICSKFAFSPVISPRVRAAFFVSIGLMAVLVISLSWRDRRKTTKEVAAEQERANRLADTQNGNSNGA